MFEYTIHINEPSKIRVCSGIAIQGRDFWLVYLTYSRLRIASSPSSSHHRTFTFATAYGMLLVCRLRQPRQHKIASPNQAAAAKKAQNKQMSLSNLCHRDQDAICLLLLLRFLCHTTNTRSESREYVLITSSNASISLARWNKRTEKRSPSRLLYTLRHAIVFNRFASHTHIKTYKRWRRPISNWMRNKTKQKNSRMNRRKKERKKKCYIDWH